MECRVGDHPQDLGHNADGHMFTKSGVLNVIHVSCFLRPEISKETFSDILHPLRNHESLKKENGCIF
jgi:hypothetical protein